MTTRWHYIYYFITLQQWRPTCTLRLFRIASKAFIHHNIGIFSAFECAALEPRYAFDLLVPFKHIYILLGMEGTQRDKRDIKSALRRLIATPSTLKERRNKRKRSCGVEKENAENLGPRPWSDPDFFASQLELENESALVMARHLNRVGLDARSLPPVIHVAGTKGKGSTCAFIESVLRHHGLTTGLFASPHLIDVRERVRVDGMPLDLKTFSGHFWKVWDAYENSPEERPGYFAFLCIVALVAFASKPVDVIVLEVGIGGRLDATNVVRRPVACGITQLDLDHTAILGSTLTEIANEKAGILKPSVPAFTVSAQASESIKALAAAAKKRSTSIKSVEPLPDDAVLGLAGKHQFENAALAVSLASCFLKATGRVESASAIARGLAQSICPGRAQVYVQQRPGDSAPITFYLDGAHTSKSLDCCVAWFRERARSNRKTFLNVSTI